MPTTTKQLTTSQATQQARRLADKVMPGQGPSVQVFSTRSHDLTTDTALIITQIAHPASAEHQLSLGLALAKLPGIRDVEQFPECTIVTREI